jgi:lipoate-protein ligase A
MGLFLEGFPTEPALDIAVSAVLHERVAQGLMAPCIRVHPTSRMVAFGRRDTHEPGYLAASEVSRAYGYAPVERLAGGRAAVFHEATLGMSVVTAEDDSTVGIRDRFRSIADATADALRILGIAAQLGEVPGEYCPGEFSVNARGVTKLAGFGQRLVKGAAHVGGVVVIDGVTEINDVLKPVYASLGLGFDPRSTGSVVDEIGPTPIADVVGALAAGLEARWDLEEAVLPRALVDEARTRVRGLLSP